MAEVVAIACEICKCIDQFIPQEVKDKVTRPVSDVIFYKCNEADLREKIKKLKKEKDEVEKKLLLAETNGQQIGEMVKPWIKNAKEVVEKFESRKGNNCFCGSSSEVGKMLDEIKKMLEQSTNFDWNTSPRVPPQIGSRYNAYKNLKSREDILVKILIALKDSTSSTKMFYVHGAPGAGKTILLEELVKRVEDEKLFHVIAKIDVSRCSDTRMIQTSIAERIELDLPEQGDVDSRASLLYRGLKHRLKKMNKIFIVFDEICRKSEVSLERIGIPFFVDGERSCRILLSSTRDDVCHTTSSDRITFELGYLEEDEAKTLFQSKLGNKITDEEYGSDKYNCLEKELLGKCGGLPGAITMVAQFLQPKWANWESVVGQLKIHNMISEGGVGAKKTLQQSIMLSYNLLEDDRKKNFFLLCCLYRPGTSIPIEDLMRLGIGLELFDRITSIKDAMQQASLLVDKLISFKLLASKDDKGCTSVHTTLHDFACSIASEDKYFLLLDNGAPWETRDIERYTIISVTTTSDVNSNHLNGPEPPQPTYAFKQLSASPLPQLRALLLKGPSSNLGPRLFEAVKYVGVLVMCNMNLKELPESIANLLHLMTLSVEYCVIDNASRVSVLLRLKVLSFRGSEIRVFPIGITKLVQLRLLDLSGCRFGTALDDMVDLPSLQGLYMRGSSFIDEDPAIELVTASLVQGLKSFKQLHTLEIEIPRTCLVTVGDLSLGHNPPRFKIAVGCKLPVPFIHFEQVLFLEEIDLRIIVKQGLRSLLKKTKYLSLVNITNVRTVVYELDEDRLVDLKYLHVGHCTEMVCIFNTNGMPVDPKILPNLETLSLEQLDSLTEIYTDPRTEVWCSKLQRLKLLNLTSLNGYALHFDHSRKLVDAEVSNCAQLAHIFSTSATSESSTADGRYNFPCLKKLNLQRLSIDQLVQTSDQTSQLLFHEKVDFPALEELSLSSLDSIKELWRSSPGEPSFGSLKSIRIVDCPLLESLCLPSVLAALSRLDSLEITSCPNMKEVIMTEANASNAIESSLLRRLELKNLPSLECFSQGRQKIEFPSLQELFLSSLPTMLTFHNPSNSDALCPPADVGNEQHAQDGINSSVKQMLFIKEIVLPSLEHLNLTAMEDTEELVEDEHAAIAFPKLKALTIGNLGKLKFIPAALLENLEQLEVKGCDSLQCLFDDEFATSMACLKMLELVDVKCLKHIQLSLLPMIQSITIHGGLLGVKPMLTSTQVAAAVVAQELKYINIEGCDDLVEIVSKECDQPQVLKNGTTMFTKLKHVKFRNLPKFTGFSSGSYSSNFPNLEKVEIDSCPCLTSFSLGKLSTPKLNSVQVAGDARTFQPDTDLNVFLQKQKQKQGNEQSQGSAESTKQLSRGEMGKAVNDSEEIFPKRSTSGKRIIAINGESSSTSTQTRHPIYVHSSTS